MTFVKDGRPDPDSQEDILNALVALAEREFGRDFTPDELSVVRAFYDPVATYLALQQQDLANVLDAAQIDHADGEALDLLTALIGVTRREAAPAESRLKFSHDSPVTRDYPIPEGTGGQTESADTIQFETDEATTLRYIDGFEDQDLSNYGGDTGVFSIQSSTVNTGSYALQASSSTGGIVDVDTEIEQGATIHFKLYVEADTIAKFLFGTSTLDDTYEAVFNVNNSVVSLDVVEGGTSTTDENTSLLFPTGEWLDVTIDWGHEGDYTILIENAAGTELVDLNGTLDDIPFTEGGYGFVSDDSSGNKYFDEVTMSEVSVDATARSPGIDTNVGEDSLIVMSSSVPGVDSVTNPIPASGGRDEEPDDDFRERAKDQLSDAMRSTLPALISRLDNLAPTRSVTVIDNDENTSDADGRPGHSFEAIVDVDQEYYEDVAQTILDTKAVGDTSVGGYDGVSVTETLELSNGQTKDITFSTPTQVTIYVDVTLDKNENYAGNEQVQDNIVQYVGGTLNSGDNTDGEIGAGDDVIYNKVMRSVMDVVGVHDVTDLQVATSDPPSGTSNITIADNEMANVDAPADNVTVTTNDV